MKAITLFIFFLFVFNTGSADNLCSGPHLGDQLVGHQLGLRSSIDFTSQRRARTEYETIRQHSYNERPCETAPRQTCYRSIRLQKVTRPTEHVVIAGETPFHIQRLQGTDYYIGWNDRVGSYLRLRCDYLARLPNGNVESRGRFACTEQDLEKIFTNITHETCQSAPTESSTGSSTSTAP